MVGFNGLQRGKKKEIMRAEKNHIRKRKNQS